MSTPRPDQPRPDQPRPDQPRPDQLRPDQLRPDITRFAAARLWAVTRAPYLASALFAAEPVAAAGSRTVAADRGWQIHADPDVIAELAAPQLGRLLIHLVAHLVRDHADRAAALRIDDRSASWWRRCVDAEINDDLVAADLLPPVANALPADFDAPDSALAETYFAMEPLLESPSHDADHGKGELFADGWDCGSAADGLDRPWDGGSDREDRKAGLTNAQAERLRHGVAEGIRRAHQQEPGSVPGGWLRWAETVLQSTTDWRRVIAAEIRRAVAAVAGSVDYTYRRPSRRSHSASGSGDRVVLPSLYRPLPEVSVVCDTSGSMDEMMLARVVSEVEAIIARTGLRATGVEALAVDTTVHTRARVRRAAELSLAGGGGTDMGIGIAAALARRPRPEVVIVLTDGFTPWPALRPTGVRIVVGILHSLHGAPPPPPEWARVVHIPG